MDLLLSMHQQGEIREVRIDEETRKVLAERMDGLASRFLNDDTELHPYMPGFRPDGDGLIELEFALPELLAKCGKALPNAIQPLGAKTIQEDKPTALVVSILRKLLEYARQTWTSPASRSTSEQLSAISSPQRRPR